MGNGHSAFGIRRWAESREHGAAYTEQRTAEQQNNPPSADRISKVGFAMLSLFYKKIEYLPSTVDIRYSLFDTYSPPLEDSLFKVSYLDQTGRTRPAAVVMRNDGSWYCCYMPDGRFCQRCLCAGELIVLGADIIGAVLRRS